MTWDSIESELRCRIFARIGHNFTAFKHLCEALDCYQYINPDARILAHASIELTPDTNPYELWKFIDLMPVCLTESEQGNVWQLIKESST